MDRHLLLIRDLGKAAQGGARRKGKVCVCASRARKSMSRNDAEIVSDLHREVQRKTIMSSILLVGQLARGRRTVVFLARLSCRSVLPDYVSEQLSISTFNAVCSVFHFKEGERRVQ